MKKDAEANADTDKKRRESVEVKNMAETMIYTTEKMMKEAEGLPAGQAGKVKEEDKKAVEEKLAALKAIKDGEDLEAIKKAADELATVAQTVGAALYQTRPEAEVSGQEEGNGKKEEGVNQSNKDEAKSNKDEEGSEAKT